MASPTARGQIIAPVYLARWLQYFLLLVQAHQQAQTFSYGRLFSR
jgi:hypothetical protein